MIKRFIKFAWNVLNNEKGIAWLGPLFSMLGAGASAYAASQRPDYTQTTQQTQYAQPQFTPQQQGLQNLLYYGAMTNLMQPGSPYQDLLNQYIYGGGFGAGAGIGGQAATGGMPAATDIISEYERQVAGAEEAIEQTETLGGDITKELLFSVRKGDLNPAEAQQRLQDLTGKSQKEASRLANIAYYQYQRETNPKFEEFINLPYLDQEAVKYIKAEQYKEYSKDESEFLDLPYLDQEVISYMESPEFTQTSEIFAPVEERIAPEGEAPVAPEGEVPEGGVLAEIMDPTWIAKQFGLAKEKGMEEIGGWYEQAARELEQRGIGQYGGLMGSQYERDVGGILGRRGEMESTLGRELSTAQIGMERQNWFDVLNALTGLQTLQSNLQTQRVTPWIQTAQQQTALPYQALGSTVTQTSPYQGPGLIQAGIGGAYAGAGLANYLGNWGQGYNQPATPYGGMTNIPATYGGSPSGYEGSMYGYGY